MKIKKIAVALGAAFSIMAFAANPANVSASERTKIVFWHEMTGPAQVELSIRTNMKLKRNLKATIMKLCKKF